LRKPENAAYAGKFNIDVPGIKVMSERLNVSMDAEDFVGELYSAYNRYLPDRQVQEAFRNGEATEQFLRRHFMDNPDMPDAMRDALISVFFGQPVYINNLPSNFFGGAYDGFVEDITFKATPTYVDVTLFVSATDFSLSTTQWETITPASLIWTGVNGTLTWTNATGALT